MWSSLGVPGAPLSSPLSTCPLGTPTLTPGRPRDSATDLIATFPRRLRPASCNPFAPPYLPYVSAQLRGLCGARRLRSFCFALAPFRFWFPRSGPPRKAPSCLGSRAHSLSGPWRSARPLEQRRSSGGIFTSSPCAAVFQNPPLLEHPYRDSVSKPTPFGTACSLKAISLERGSRGPPELPRPGFSSAAPALLQRSRLHRAPKLYRDVQAEYGRTVRLVPGRAYPHCHSPHPPNPGVAPAQLENPPATAPRA